MNLQKFFDYYYSNSIFTLVMVLLFKNCKLPTIISAIGCLIHFPFSFALHMHKAINYDIFLCNKLFNLTFLFMYMQFSQVFLVDETSTIRTHVS